MISICMATYNGAKYIKEQVDSIIPQLAPGDELIVSDDGSTDSTIAILNSYNDPRIKIFHNTKSKGVVGNFENALSRASGEYLFLSDQDDVWCDNKVLVCMQALKRCDLVLHDANIFKSSKTEINSFYAMNKSGRGYFRNMYKNSYIGCCMAFRRRLLSAIIPFPRGCVAHDLYIGLLAERRFTVEHIEDVLMHYRRHDSNASPTTEKSGIPLWFRVKYRIDMFINTFY